MSPPRQDPIRQQEKGSVSVTLTFRPAILTRYRLDVILEKNGSQRGVIGALSGNWLVAADEDDPRENDLPCGCDWAD